MHKYLSFFCWSKHFLCLFQFVILWWFCYFQWMLVYFHYFINTIYDISSWCDYIKNYLPWSSLSNIKDYLPCTEICVNFKSLLFDSQFVHVHDMIKCYLKGHTLELNKIHLCRTTFFEKYKLGFPAWIIIKISCKIYVSCILLTA